MSVAQAQAIVIGSEAALSLYPITVKAIPTNLTTQILARFLTFSVAAAVLAKPSDLALTWMTSGGILRSTLLGLLSLLHVGVSYYAFKELTAGVAMSLFYLYPLFNLLGGAIGYGESITPIQIALMLLAMVGVWLVSQEANDGETPHIHWKGVAAGLMAALTETGMYFAVRTAAQPNPYYAILELFPGGLFALAAALLAAKGGALQLPESVDLRGSVWGPLILFNIIIGFVGYALRYYAVKKLPTFTFSILSFVGVVASFVFGWFFLKEKPTARSVLGAACITVASGLSARP